MMPARYLRASYNWLIGQTSHKFIQYGAHEEPCRIDVPFYLWNENPKAGNKVIDEGRELHRVNTFKLNQLSVGMTRGYHNGHIVFPEPKTGRRMDIVIAVDAGIKKRPNGSTYYTDTESLAYNITINNRAKYGVCSMPVRPAEFEFLTELGHWDNRGQCVDNFNYGITPDQYLVYYKNKMLNGESYVLFCGPWCILLDDELKFDTIACLAGKSEDAIIVEKFLYSVNPYIVKVMTLMK